jgi:hypothetical protein
MLSPFDRGELGGQEELVSHEMAKLGVEQFAQ